MAQPVFALSTTGFGVDVLTNSGPICKNASNSAICTDNKNPSNIYGNGGLIENITNLIAWIAGGAAVLLIVVSGVGYITSGGDAEKAKGSKRTIIAALIGIAVIVLARSLINFVVGKL